MSHKLGLEQNFTLHEEHRPFSIPRRKPGQTVRCQSMEASTLAMHLPDVPLQDYHAPKFERHQNQSVAHHRPEPSHWPEAALPFLPAAPAAGPGEVLGSCAPQGRVWDEQLGPNPAIAHARTEQRLREQATRGIRK